MTPTPTNPRYRLQKGDAALLVKSLKDRGLKVHTRKGTRIDAYNPQSHEYVCGFTWHKRRQCPSIPGRWSFDFTVANIFSMHDLKIALKELGRVSTLMTLAQNSWAEFMDTKSDKRWEHYLGIMAALFVPKASAKEGHQDD